jgi:hypothetical protein
MKFLHRKREIPSGNFKWKSGTAAREDGTRTSGMACAKARSRDQNPAAAIRAILSYVFQFIRSQVAHSNLESAI